MIKSCKICKINFNVRASEECCSVKCRLLNNIKIINNCWIWQGGIGNRYGKISVNGVSKSTHRKSYEIFIGPIPSGKFVCHKCDIPLCINPEHLFVGDAKENRKDANIKNRLMHIKGENNFFAKLTNVQIEEMKILRSLNFSYSRLCRIFNCSITHIIRILKNKSRKVAS